MQVSIRIASGMILALLAAGLPAVHAEEPVKRPKLRKQVMLLRAELAELATQVSYLSRQESDGGDVAPGLPPGSLCADPCSTDSDGDGLGDCEDWCPCDPDTADEDADQIPDCTDPCPGDAAQACLDPCNLDSDGDGTSDCEDACPWDPAPAGDEDADGIPDCQDYCPGDADNTCFEPCKIDRDGDGVADCEDGCPWIGSDGSSGPAVECVPPEVGN